MGHYVREPNEMFRSVRYNTKSTAELREAMAKKVVALREHIEGREQRMKRIREEYSIDAELLARLIIQFQKDESGCVSYNNQGEGRDMLIPAGVIANLIREQEMIDSERHQIRKLELILRNIRDTESYIDGQTGELRSRPCLHQLTDEELEFLGF